LSNFGGRTPPPEHIAEERFIYKRKLPGPVADIQIQPAAIAEDGIPPLRHVAIIMDGNGRWANRRGLPRSVGHRMGVEALRRTVRAAIELGIPHLTIYTFSSENWSRPRAEVDELMRMMKRFVRRDLVDLDRNGVRIRVIGERIDIDPELLKLIEEAEALTAGNKRLELIVAFNYGSRTEIAKAARRLAEKAVSGALDPAAITPDLLAAELDTSDIPDPDLLIRTSGEVRLSNFLLWQAAYAELVFIDACWPDFGRELLEQAIAEYRSRDRRYGGLSRRADGLKARRS
jgi:undecaprenyl diphosphate synthase